MSDAFSQNPGLTSDSATPTLPATDSSIVYLPITISDSIYIPGWVRDLETFRQWARSEEFPDKGRFAFLNGVLWMDLEMQQINSHVGVKTEFASILSHFAKATRQGIFLTDGVYFSNPTVGLSTVPDGLFFSYNSLNSGKIRLIEGANQGYVEFEGTADMVLEVISSSSVKKDTEILRDLYWQAGILEFWLVDARGPEPIYNILVPTSKGYAAIEAREGWLFSKVFGQWFQLKMEKTATGLPSYSLKVRP